MRTGPLISSDLTPSLYDSLMATESIFLRAPALLEALGSEITSVHWIEGAPRRCRVRLSDGRSVYLKTATTPRAVAELRRQNVAYDRLASTSPRVAPNKLGFVDHATGVVLILEDLADARRPPPWTAGDVAIVRAAVEGFASMSSDWPVLAMSRLRESWRRVSAEPSAFLSTRLCTRAWFDNAVPRLIEASLAAPTNLSTVVHFDLRNDGPYIVGRPNPRALFADWHHAGRGPEGLDLACLAPRIRLEGGPLPEEAFDDDTVHRFAPWVAGFLADRAGRANASMVGRLELRQLRIALAWVARVVGLVPPDGDWAQRGVDKTKAAYERGDLDEAGYFRMTEEDLIDAYLATDNPIAASGKSGDAADWRWAREVILDACPSPTASVLDVGCANGHLMASLARWGIERGLQLDIHGLEISARLAEVARRRLPNFDAHIYVGNVQTWRPPQRFDLVHVGLDYVPPGAQRALLLTVLDRFLTPRGRVVLRPERVRVQTAQDNANDPVAKLRSLGFEPAGIAEARHPSAPHLLRRTAWLEPTS